MKEADIQSKFGNWLKINCPYESLAYELKITKKGSFTFSDVKEHQIEGLLQAKRGIYHRIQDNPWGGGNRFQFKKPFDCLWLKAREAYVAVCFYEPRVRKDLYLIPIDSYLKIREDHPRKSIRAGELDELFNQYGLQLIQL